MFLCCFSKEKCFEALLATVPPTAPPSFFFTYTNLVLEYNSKFNIGLCQEDYEYKKFAFNND